MWSPGLLQKSPLMRSVYRISCSIFILLSFVGELVIGNPVYFAQRKISAVYHKPENSKWSEVGYLKPVILTSLVVGVVALSVMGRSYWANPVSPGITSAILGTPLRDMIFAAPSQQGITSLVNYWPLALGMIPITGLGLRGIGRLCFREGHPASSSTSELPAVVPALTKGDEAEVIENDEKRKRQSLVVEEIVVDTTRASDAMTASVRKKPPYSDHSSPTAPPAVIMSPVTPAGAEMPPHEGLVLSPIPRSAGSGAGENPDEVVIPFLPGSPPTPAGAEMPENSLRLSKSKEPRHRTESPPSPSLFSSKK